MIQEAFLVSCGKIRSPCFYFSTHAMPFQAPCEWPIVSVPHRRSAVCENIQTSTVLEEYTQFMCGVDVADQLRASYSCQVPSHKWWHRIFFFLLEVIVVNMYIIYLDSFTNVKWERTQETPMTHFQFKQSMSEALLADLVLRNREPQDLPLVLERPVICTPTNSKQQRRCVVCNNVEPHWYCHKCGDKWMCLCRGCFERWHTDLALRRKQTN